MVTESPIGGQSTDVRHGLTGGVSDRDHLPTNSICSTPESAFRSLRIVRLLMTGTRLWASA